MTPALADLLDELARRRVTLTVDGDRIRYRPKSVVSESLRARLRDMKGEVLDLLLRPGSQDFDPGELAVLARAGLQPHEVPEVAFVKQAFAGMGLRLVGFEPKPMPQTALDLDLDWREMFEERAAIMEFDGNLPREQAERLALADILALMDGSGRTPRSEVHQPWQA